jgi:Uma2 family endonuclease
MATVQTKLMTADEFWDWCCRPENAGKRVELEAGEVIEMPPPGERRGGLVMWIGYLLLNYVIARGRGSVHGDTRLLVQEGPDTVRWPDVILIDEARTFDQFSPGMCRLVPALIVEVLSPGDLHGQLMRRIKQYLKRGVSLVWAVEPDGRTVTVYRGNELPHVLDESDTLTGDSVLPGLSIPVRTVFCTPGTPEAAA